jgi:hypothetical protein
MRGQNLFVTMGSLRPLRQIKLKSPTLHIFKPLLFGTQEAQKSITNQELQIRNEILPVKVKTTFLIQKIVFLIVSCLCRLSLPNPEIKMKEMKIMKIMKGMIVTEWEARSAYAIIAVCDSALL